MTKPPKPQPKICRSFSQDFPEFVARAEALDVSIQIQKGRRNGWDRVYWLDGHRQLTGYSTNSDGSRFTHAHAVANIHKILSKIEADREVVASLSVAQRFARVMDEMRKVTPQYGMIGNVQLPCGDDGYVALMFGELDGGVSLRGIGKVASAEISEPGPDRMARLCAALEADFAARAGTLKETEAA